VFFVLMLAYTLKLTHEEWVSFKVRVSFGAPPPRSRARSPANPVRDANRR
jgi:hypothetical protein